MATANGDCALHLNTGSQATALIALSCNILGNAGAGRSDGKSALREAKLSQIEAARKGDIERLKQLYSEAGQWWGQTADAAFGAGQLGTFYWLRSQSPPCPESFPTSKWTLDACISGRFTFAGYNSMKPLPQKQQQNLRERGRGCSFKPSSMQQPVPRPQLDHF